MRAALTLDDFCARIEVSPDGCWLWKGRLHHGYAGWAKGMAGHRWAYLTMVGPVDRGLELDHLCRRPACVNPLHLEVVTHKVNMERGHAGRPKGVSSALTKENHRRIRHPYNEYSRWCPICRRGQKWEQIPK
jgi:hypothetical protein